MCPNIAPGADFDYRSRRRRSPQQHQSGRGVPISYLNPHHLLRLDRIGCVSRVIDSARPEPRAGMVAGPARDEAGRHGHTGHLAELFTLQRAVNKRGEPRAGAGGGQGGQRDAVPGEGGIGVEVGEGIG
eukprot:scaffold5188_cov101-Isochrysis_galbana.AAC.3